MRVWPWALLGLPIPAWLAWLALQSLRLGPQGEALYVGAGVALAVGSGLGWMALAWAAQHRRVSAIWPFALIAALGPPLLLAIQDPLTDSWLALAWLVVAAAAVAWLLALPFRWVVWFSGTGAFVGIAFAIVFVSLPRDPDVALVDVLWTAAVLGALGLCAGLDVPLRLRYQRRPERPPPRRPPPDE